MKRSSVPSINVIERTEGLSGEPLMTQWLAHLLQYPQFRDAIVRYLYNEDLESALLDGLEIEDETGSAGGDGRPDLRIVGDEVYLIIENKFGAPRTDNQPGGYLRDLQTRSQPYRGLIFLVPCWREPEMIRLAELNDCDIPITVKLWEELVTRLDDNFPASELVQEFVGEIRRRCNVMKPLDEREFNESIEGLRRFLRQQEFVKRLKADVENHPLFRGAQVSMEKLPRLDGEQLYFGVDISDGGDVAWIGFWKVNGSMTPLFAYVYKSAETRYREFSNRLDYLRDRGVVLARDKSGGWLIQIPIKEIRGNSIDEQAKSAVEYFCRVLEGKA